VQREPPANLTSEEIVGQLNAIGWRYKTWDSKQPQSRIQVLFFVLLAIAMSQVPHNNGMYLNNRLDECHVLPPSDTYRQLSVRAVSTFIHSYSVTITIKCHGQVVPRGSHAYTKGSTGSVKGCRFITTNICSAHRSSTL
jgi:hypothetical protein